MQETVKNRRGHGAVANVAPPVLDDAVGCDENAAAMLISLVNKSLQQFGRGIRDARPDVAEVASLILHEDGYKAIVAYNARDALDALALHPEIGLLFADLIMPGGMNGVMLAQEARRRRPRLRILLTTGYADASIARSDLDGTDFPLLNKP